MKNPIATILMKSGNKITIELFPKEAPNTVNSFIYLAKKGSFNNREIKRIVPDFVIQPTFTAFDKDPDCDFLIDGEFRENGHDNNLKVSKWTVAMGGDGKSVASGSCFFITVGNCEEKLDGKYAGFGKVIDGFEEVERLEGIETKSVDIGVSGVIVNEPITPEIIEEVNVDTFGITYDEPIKLEQK